MNRPTPLTSVSAVRARVVVEGAQAIEVKPPVLEPFGEIVQVDRLGAGHPDTAEGFGVGGAELGRCGHPAAPEGLEPGEDRRGGRKRELLSDHLQHERSPQVARQAVEETVGV